VDPLTGVIVKGIEHQVRTLTNGDIALDTTLTFNDDSVALQLKQAKDGHNKISQLTVTLPIVGLIVGIAAIVGGIVLGGRSKAPGSSAAQRTAPP